jgi:Tetratricopeptide repeat
LHLARTLLALAEMKDVEGKFTDAEPLCERALKIQEADYGRANPQLIRTLSLYTRVEQRLGNKDKASALAARAAALRKQLAEPR